MSVFEMVVLIVLIGCATGIVKTVIARRDVSDEDGRTLREQDDRIADLEERVRVLEAVVTDSKYQLQREIDKL